VFDRRRAKRSDDGQTVVTPALGSSARRLNGAPLRLSSAAAAREGAAQSESPLQGLPAESSSITLANALAHGQRGGSRPRLAGQAARLLQAPRRRGTAPAQSVATKAPLPRSSTTTSTAVPRSVPPNPSLESGRSEAVRLGRAGGSCSIVASPAKPAHLYASAQLER
jgi:hypothetical protein